ncbi:reticulon-4-interacting protein 1 homolog, mitochondrial-like isoform X3 [Cimex lectularius]|uniref:Enoyl reductase (ER) domain-containing protein n=2 Tax=Cimex lectularius TaxID=79782 RepID=A0A8I6SAZ1_CIMLE|nr:reticulon-4-interacting protein 1 homolog, mitochondrial-like isoform X3 [Cimex lectularius]
MDEFIFHLGRTTEFIQIWLNELGQKLSQISSGLEDSFVVVLSSPRILIVKDVAENIYKNTWRFFTGALHQFSTNKLSSIFFKNFGHDINRSTIFACCIGFTIGSSIGFAIGFSLQSPRSSSVLMRAITATSYDAESIALLEDVFVPKLHSPDQILVEVKFASLDAFDLRIASGYGKQLRNILSSYDQNIYCGLPLVLGRQGSGVVIEIGSRVDDFELGNAVYFCNNHIYNGCLAEYVVLNSKDVAKIPKGIGFEAAASIAQPSVDAWRAVVTKAGLSNRNAHCKKIFVHCATTGIGWMVVQMCAALGAKVVASCTNNAKEQVKILGAASVHTVESGELLNHNNKYDIVFNTVGSIASEFCHELCLAKGKVIEVYPKRLTSDNFGCLLSYIYSVWIKITYGVFGIVSWQESRNGHILEKVSKLVERQLLQPFVDSIFYPEELDNAVNNVESGFGSTLLRFEYCYKVM